MFITAFDGNFVISLINVSFIEDMYKSSIIKSSAKSLFIVIFCFPTNTPQVEGKNCLLQNIHYHGFYISISQYFQKNLVLFVFHFPYHNINTIWICGFIIIIFIIIINENPIFGNKKSINMRLMFFILFQIKSTKIFYYQPLFFLNYHFIIIIIIIYI